MTGWLIAWILVAVALYALGFVIAYSGTYSDLDTTSEKTAFWLLMGPGWLIASAIQSFVLVGTVWLIVKLVLFLAKQ